MTTTYRMIAIDDGVERDVGVIDTLELPPNAALIVSVSPDLLDYDMGRLREEFRAFFDQHDGWKGKPVGIIRGGDMRFLRLVAVEASNT